MMNRQQRRAEMRRRERTDRSERVAAAFDYLALASAADPTITGATMILPDGEVRYLSATRVGAADPNGGPH
jgi:hypothetical protein